MEQNINCPVCQSDSVIKFGKTNRQGGRVQRYSCNECGHVFTIQQYEGI